MEDWKEEAIRMEIGSLVEVRDERILLWFGLRKMFRIEVGDVMF